MELERVCPAGHRFSLGTEQGSGELRCPECDAVVPSNETGDDSSESPRMVGLWGMMGGGSPSETEETDSPPTSDDSDTPAQSTDIAEPEAQDSDEPEPAAAPKGLWGLMTPQQDSASESDEKTESVESEKSPAEPAGAKGLWAMMNTKSSPADSDEKTDDAKPDGQKGLWSVMQTSETDESSKVEEKKSAPKLPPLPMGDAEPLELSELGGTETKQYELDDDELDVVADLEPLSADMDDEESAVQIEAEPFKRRVRSRGAMQSFLLGLTAIPASALAMMPEFWTRFPATILGFSALIIGYLAMGEVRRSRGKERGKVVAGLGMLFGILGMFLGPYFFTDFGIYWRKTRGRQQTFANLETVGQSMNDYRRKYSQFPPGSIHKLNAEGEDVALHSWQTTLLPFLGDDAAEIHGAIDLAVPYNSEINHPAMKRDVPAFFAAGADRTKIANGFAISHFSGLSGQRDVDGVGRVSVGIFGRNSRVRYGDVVDGLSQTLVAGEISVDFRPWGEPNAWRSIGEGLNKGRDGFGNHDRTGAMFLRADGSVKFFSNETDLEVLQKLSTRDGQESVPNDY